MISSCEYNPCLKEFWAERAFPMDVVGPVESWLLARLTSARERRDVWAVISIETCSQDKEQSFARAAGFQAKRLRGLGKENLRAALLRGAGTGDNPETLWIHFSEMPTLRTCGIFSVYPTSYSTIYAARLQSLPVCPDPAHPEEYPKYR